jgi:FAD:protein FMN transferase
MKIPIYLSLIFFLAACNNTPQKNIISGEAQGTTYHISYFGPAQNNLKTEIDSLLADFDYSLSTYNPNSLITQLNNNATDSTDEYFRVVFQKSKEVSILTDGAFDVTISPILNVWGFGHTPQAKTDSSGISELLNLVGYQKAEVINNRLNKSDSLVTLNFNAIAQGYSVDLLAEYLLSIGINDFLVELGGEIRANGTKENGESWKIGIDKPIEDVEGRPLQAVIKLNNRSLATSGNYRKYFVEDGKRYGHSINPRTGYPAKNTLLSATVIADDCMTADAYATAFMVMGVEKTLEFLEKNGNLNLEVYLIYSEGDDMKTYLSEGLKDLLEEVN